MRYLQRMNSKYVFEPDIDSHTDILKTQYHRLHNTPYLYLLPSGVKYADRACIGTGQEFQEGDGVRTPGGRRF